MRIAITGATGFLGRYIVRHLAEQGHTLRAWRRPESDTGGFEGCEQAIQWIPGDLADAASMPALVAGTDAVVHAGLYRPGRRWRGGEGDLVTFVERNVLGTIRLIEAARSAGAQRFVYISSCSVHDVILEDRPLDEAHPTWSASHYGAHKAAVENFIHSYALADGYEICSLRPTGIYGLARPPAASKWFDIVQAVLRGEPIRLADGGKEVHAVDVARAVGILLTAEGVAGRAYNCYDMYVAFQDVAAIAKRLSGSGSEIVPLNKGPRHQIDTSRLRALGMAFGGRQLLESTVAELVDAAGR